MSNQRNKSNDIPEIIQPFATIEYMKKMLINPISCVTVDLETLDKKESIKLI